MLCVVTDGWVEPTGLGVGVRVAPRDEGGTYHRWTHRHMPGNCSRLRMSIGPKQSVFRQ